MTRYLTRLLTMATFSLALGILAPATASADDCSSSCQCDTDCNASCDYDGEEITCGEYTSNCGMSTCDCNGGPNPVSSSNYAGSFAYGDYWCRFAWVTQNWVEEGNGSCPYYKNANGCDYDWRQLNGTAEDCCNEWGCDGYSDPCQG